jgi:hypothetical protein
MISRQKIWIIWWGGKEILKCDFCFLFQEKIPELTGGEWSVKRQAVNTRKPCTSWCRARSKKLILCEENELGSPASPICSDVLGNENTNLQRWDKDSLSWLSAEVSYRTWIISQIHSTDWRDRWDTQSVQMPWWIHHIVTEARCWREGRSKKGGLIFLNQTNRRWQNPNHEQARAKRE